MAFFTKYHFRSELELYRLFSYQTWHHLDFNSKMAALQELENRVAKAYGNAPRRVVAQTMRTGYTYGGYSHKDDVIQINRDLIESARLTCEKDGLSISSIKNNANAELVDTIFHENYHAYQRDVIDGKIAHPDKREAAIWATNLKRDQNGNLVHYLSDGIEYRIQSCERTAFREGESGTRRVFGMLEKEYGPDYGYSDYQRNLANNSYEKQLAYAQACSGNPYFQEDLDEEMLQQYAQNHGLPYVRQSRGKEETDHAAAMNALQDYMNQHNYSAMDYPEYSQDPEWQQLHQNVYGKIDGLNTALEQAQSPEAHTAAVNALSEYMNEHNYGDMDYPEYSKDPEWQKLNNDLLVADGKAPIHYNSDIANNQDSTMNESPDKPVEEAKENTQDTTFKLAGQSRLPVVDASEGQNDAIAAPNQAPSEETSEKVENSEESAFDKQNGTDINESQGNTEAPALHDQLGENELETQDNHHIETQQLDNTEDANLDNTLDENMREAQSNIDRSVLDEQTSKELDASQEDDVEFALDESSTEELDVSQGNDEEFSLDERSDVELNASQEDDVEFALDEPSNEKLDASQESSVDFSLDELPDEEIGEGQSNMADQFLDVQSEEATEENAEQTNTAEASHAAQEQENIEASSNLMDATLDEHTEETAAEAQDNIMDQSLDAQHDEDSVESQDNTMDASMDEQHDAGESESQSNAMDDSLDEQHEEAEAQDNTMESSLAEDHDMKASQGHATDTQQTEQYADDETASQDQSQSAEDTVTMDDTLDNAPAYDSTESTTGPDHENEEDQDYSISM